MEFLSEEISDYIHAHTQEEPEILKQLNRDTYAKVLMPRMLSGHLQGRTLSFLSKLIRPKYVLEIGTFTGYSAICLTEGLQDGGKVITLDINEELEDFANSYFKKAGLEDRIEMIIGDAKVVIPDLPYEFDIAFIDADKANYPAYYELVLKKLSKGGFILADNVLWSGKVTDPDQKDEETSNLRIFNEMVQKDPRTENIMLPVRDGLSIIKVL